MKYLRLVTVCVSLLHICTAMPAEDNPCLHLTNPSCGSCLSAGRECAFCILEDYNKRNKPRCDLKTTHESNGCTGINLIAPRSKHEIVQNGQAGGQLTPHRVKLFLRPNDPQTFNLKFELAENYPADLYFLMDLSYSMHDDKQNVANLGNVIVEGLTRYTTNLRIGYGSFVDKVMLPFTSQLPNKLLRPCPVCSPPYGFINHLSLNEDAQKFVNEVLRSKTSGNLDRPEGGFDAMMQSIVCNLSGTVKPNDGKCHLDSEGKYNYSTLQDFPSIHQLAVKIREKNINVVFAVTKDYIHVYKLLEDFIPGSSTAELARDSSNILSLLLQQYDTITSKLELTTENAEGLDIKFETACKGTNLTTTNICEDLKIGDKVNFTVRVEATACPKDRKRWIREFKIKPIGLMDTLVVELNLICECYCEKPEYSEQISNSPVCENQGTLVCGTCLCNDEFYGKTCACSSGNTTSDDKQNRCKAPDSELYCSDRGECTCGKCECNQKHPDMDQRYSGEFCECDDYSCPSFNGKLCGGLKQGTCECGECNCKNGWSGKNCGCTAGKNSCIDSKGGICNGMGRCVCNQCKCNEDSSFRGKTCETNVYIREVCRRCRNCVNGVVSKTETNLEQDCNKNCVKQEFINVVKDLSDSFSRCEFKDDDDCTFYFNYYVEGGDLKIQAQEGKECPQQVNALDVVLGAIGGLIGAGLIALLVWKIVTVISDKRKLAKFKDENEAVCMTVY